MELNNNCGVYLIVSPSNGRYVGSSKSLKKRFNRYKNYSCSKQSAILASLKKYGYENHKIKILMYCEESELLFWERVFGDIYLASTNFKNGLTITLPGYNDVPQVRSEDFKKRVSKTQKKRFEKKKEREKTSKTTKNALSKIKDKISIAQKKRYECQEQRDIRSKTRIEYYKNNPEVIMKMSEDTKKRMKNNQELKERCLSGFKKYYEENPNIRSERMKKWHKENPNYLNQSKKLKEFYKNNPEYKKAASEKAKLQFSNPANHYASKKIINIETGETFSCAKELAKHLNKPAGTVRNWLRGDSKNKTSYRYA